ncbi:MAG: hypothetical protein MZW92_63045 [Comamonadaceae bacterium]|nr:hypothetical protein [Comamonadaceae bacterium]
MPRLQDVATMLTLLRHMGVDGRAPGRRADARDAADARHASTRPRRRTSW